MVRRGRSYLGQTDAERRSHNAVRIRSAAEHPLYLEDPVWDDSMQPGLAVRVGASAPDLGNFVTSGLQIYLFAGTGVTIETVHFTLQIPHTYKEGTALYPHVHWTPVDGNAGNVVWQLTYSVAKIGSIFPSPATIASEPMSAGGVAWKHRVTAIKRIVDTSLGISSVIVGKLFRDPANSGDTYESDVALLGFDIHHEIDTLGSREEYTK